MLVAVLAPLPFQLPSAKTLGLISILARERGVGAGPGIPEHPFGHWGEAPHSLQLPEQRVQPSGHQCILPVTSDRAKGNSLNLCQEKFRLNIGNIYSPEVLSSHGTGCPEQ